MDQVEQIDERTPVRNWRQKAQRDGWKWVASKSGWFHADLEMWASQLNVMGLYYVQEDNRISQQLADSIRLILASHEMSQSALASLMGVNPSLVCKWLSGKHNFELRTIANLEAAMGVTLISVNIYKTWIPKNS